ncbi:ribosome quality control complex subunit TCF25-like isoform X2 [Montipora capricornis]|uniref:ribosome quality control complex subunit TCF25-like isoform X2 n=1 Tax=Montipora capricornis TaxID=246305 RepID=UPI0035F14A33
MSSRVLRKLQGGNELDISRADEEDEDEFHFLPVTSKKTKEKALANPFDLLNVEDQPSNEDSQDSQEDEIPRENARENLTEEKPCSTEPLSKRTKKKKKKKGNRDIKNEAIIKQKEKTDEPKNKDNGNHGKIRGPIHVATSGQTTSRPLDTKALLGIEHRNLNAENEMRKRFGSHVVRAENNRQRKSHQRVYQPATRLVTPKQSWPRIGATGIRMEMDEMNRGHSFFAFHHSPSYQEVQFQFLDAVESLNPNNISDILNTHPYHVDSLLQLSEICKMGEDYQMAAELIERALYCFERSFHTIFNLTTGYSRLRYRRAENRSFYVALFRQIIFVGQKGCYRTALELCKLLLNLDPDEDPLAVLLMIDFYALRSEQFDFLVRLFEEWGPHRNLSQLPNFAFSVALAHFHSSKKDGETKKADEMLQEALIMFPMVLLPLMDKCNVALDSSLIKHPFFSPASAMSYPLALKQLEALYIGRTYHAWKETEVIDWLAMNVKIVLERVDAKDPLVEQCTHKRQVRYKGTPRNVYRHIIMSDIKDATASLPVDLANVPLLSYDPLPPLDSVSGYKRPSRSTRLDQEHGALSMFFRSLLPSFNTQAPIGQRERLQARLEPPIEGAEGAPRPLHDTDLARGVENLLTAMRELLNTLSQRDPPEGEQQGETGDDDRDPDEWEDGDENN